ncbi:MAG: insulinase family protein [Phycisphaerae bacterium]|nr:insulinase family protein [Phycisphaerae bacterium]MDW8261073.1 pitrilysin family protein [Phycisphaerales bacterium]
MSDPFFQSTFANGLVLAAERIPGMHSAAMTLLVPAGSSGDPETIAGSATVLADLILRGAGSRDNRSLTEHLDSLGLQRSSSAGVYHLRLSAAAPAENVMAGLEAFADVVRRPRLPADGFEAARELTRQSLAGIEDEPRQKLSVALREVYFPWPLGRNPLGTFQTLDAMTLQAVREDHRRRFVPRGAIFAFAGKLDFDRLHDRIGALFGDWPDSSPPELKPVPSQRKWLFIPQKSEQTHIGLAWPTVDETHEDSYVARLACDILGGGMSSRLFSEVRERRALCYAVSVGYASLKGLGCFMGYAGSSNDRAQATLDCILEETRRLANGVTADELQRAKVGLKANTIMSGESTSARASAVAHDVFLRGRIRSIDEIKQSIDAVTLDRINAFVASASSIRPTVVVLGPRELRYPDFPG